MATEWFISANPKKYDVIGAFKELKKIDWKQSTNIEVGDIVYIYVTEGYQALKYKCKVNKVDLSNVEIDDRKFDISGEFDGTYGRYMELELIKELKGDLYKRDAMMNHGFVSPQSPVRVIQEMKCYLDFVQKLQDEQELDIDEHDGSYELVRETINSYANMGDLSTVDYRDLNLVYLMTVGTWKQKIPAKKKTILDSNLPELEKDRLIEVLNKIWAKAENHEYQNEDEGRPSIGMFGTGFFTFSGKTDENSPKNFIQMCIDIRDINDEEEIFSICSKVLDGKFRGMKAASASMVLHCLKPEVFPIFNSNMGADNTFVYLGAKMKWKTEIYSYIKNAQIVKKLRDENFTVKNYRIFDMAAWEIGKVKEDEEVIQNEYWPSFEEYNPGITCEQWVQFILSDYKEYPSTLEMLFVMLENGGKATCKFLAQILNVSTAACISRGANFGRRAAKYYSIEEYKDEEGKKTPFVTCFVGRYIESNLYEWKLRDELKEALESDMILDVKEKIKNKSDNDMIKYDKNIILYGPPGTGKTYNTVIYAVAICDGKSIEEVESMPYEEVYKRYNILKDKEKRIAFTTFHQSYGYEEFIEGIRPNVEETGSDISYSIEDGVFKAFCKAAEIPQVDDIDYAANVWKVTLKCPGDSDLKRECFKDGTIKFNWKTLEESKEITSQCFLNQFIQRMKIGDIVVSYHGAATDIDAVGIVTGEAEYDETKNSFRWHRTVKWLYTGEPVNIKELNGGKNFSGDPIYCLKRIKIAELLNLVKPQNYVANNKNYVFIIDEINRGNISKILGELITLIEDTKRKGADEEMSAILPYSAEKFSVPQNIYILGTMNTADRSIALMDTALRRRFRFIEKMSDTDVLRKMGIGKLDFDGTTLDVATMLDIINERIEFLYDREHTIGHAFFTGLKEKPTIEKLASIFEKSIIPLLQEYFYEDYQKIQLVLGDNAKEDSDIKFIVDKKVELKSLFMGSVEDVVDEKEVSYEVNHDAFYNILSYKGIANGL